MMADLALKASILFALAWAAASLLRRRSAATRHAVWIAVMAAVLIMPVGAVWSPDIALPLLPAPSVESGSGHVDNAEPPRSMFEGLGTSHAHLARDVVDEGRLTPSEMLFAAWVVIALLLVIRLVLAHWSARRLLAACEPAPERLATAASRVAAELNSPATPVYLAPRGTMPAVIGTTHPAIILPADSLEWPEERLRLVLLHECAHVRRRDPLLQVVANVAAAAYWWHPLSWVAARSIVRERELACDDLVVAAGTRGDCYAQHLLDIARSLKPGRQPALAALAMARISQLEGRVVALLEDRPRSMRPARTMAALGTLAAIACFLIAPLKLVARGADIPIAQAANEPQQATQPVVVNGAPGNARSREAEAPNAQIAPVQTSHPNVYLEALKDPDEDVRRLAVIALMKMRDPRNEPHLIEAAGDASEDVRRTAAAALAAARSQVSFDALMQLAKDISEDVRRTAAAALGARGKAEAVAALRAMMDDSSGDVRRAALAALMAIEGRGTDTPVDAIADGVATGVTASISQAVAGSVTAASLRDDAGIQRSVSEQAAAAFRAQNPAAVAVYGDDIARPGQYRWRRGMTVGDLMEAAGGMRDVATGSAAIVRLTLQRDAATSATPGALVASFASPSTLLWPGDVIEVHKKRP